MIRCRDTVLDDEVLKPIQFEYQYQFGLDVIKTVEKLIKQGKMQ